MHEQDEVATGQLSADIPAAAPPVHAQAPGVSPPTAGQRGNSCLRATELPRLGRSDMASPSRNAGATDNIWATFGWYLLAYTLIALAWVGVLCWYLIFGLLVVPYRLIRRGQRKRKLEEARHRELMSAQQGQVNS